MTIHSTHTSARVPLTAALVLLLTAPLALLTQPGAAQATAVPPTAAPATATKPESTATVRRETHTAAAARVRAAGGLRGASVRSIRMRGTNLVLRWRAGTPSSLRRASLSIRSLQTRGVSDMFRRVDVRDARRSVTVKVSARDAARLRAARHVRLVTTVRSSTRSGGVVTGARVIGSNFRPRPDGRRWQRTGQSSCAVLRRADVRGCDLSGANLRRLDLRRADLRRSDLTLADLSGSRIAHSRLAGARMTVTRATNLAGRPASLPTGARLIRNEIVDPEVWAAADARADSPSYLVACNTEVADNCVAMDEFIDDSPWRVAYRDGRVYTLTWAGSKNHPLTAVLGCDPDRADSCETIATVDGDPMDLAIGDGRVFVATNKATYNCPSTAGDCSQVTSTGSSVIAYVDGWVFMSPFEVQDQPYRCDPGALDACVDYADSLSDKAIVMDLLPVDSQLYVVQAQGISQCDPATVDSCTAFFDSASSGRRIFYRATSGDGHLYPVSDVGVLYRCDSEPDSCTKIDVLKNEAGLLDSLVELTYGRGRVYAGSAAGVLTRCDADVFNSCITLASGFVRISGVAYVE